MAVRIAFPGRFIPALPGIETPLCLRKCGKQSTNAWPDLCLPAGDPPPRCSRCRTSYLLWGSMSDELVLSVWWALARWHRGEQAPSSRCWPQELTPYRLVSALVMLLSSGDSQLYLNRCHHESGAYSLGRSPTLALSALPLNSRGTAPPSPLWPESKARGPREVEQEPPPRAGRP